MVDFCQGLTLFGVAFKENQQKTVHWERASLFRDKKTQNEMLEAVLFSAQVGWFVSGWTVERKKSSSKICETIHLCSPSNGQGSELVGPVSNRVTALLGPPPL